MGEQPRVSIVIPTYNYARFVGDAIDSALAQTWPAIEVIVVDDGSTDDTRSVVESRAAEVTVVRQAHAGVAAARNAGIRASHGDYVCYVDADDTLPPQRVARQVGYFETLPLSVGMVFTNAHIVDAADPTQSPRLAYARPPLVDDAVRRLLHHNYIFSATAMFRRGALDAVGPYDERLVTGEDYDLFLRLARRFGMAYLDEPLYRCRVHSTSQMHRSPPAEQCQTLLRILNKQFDDPALPPALRTLRHTAVANVHREIARQYLERGQRLPALAELARAVVWDPTALLNPRRLARFIHAAQGLVGQRTRA